MAGGGGSIEGGEPEFQVAPMIDVLLVLLVFFMTITSMEVLKVDQDIVLPVAPDAEKREKERGEVIVNVRWNAETKKARYSLDQIEFDKIDPLKEAVARASNAAKAGIKAGWNPAVRMVIRGDASLPAMEIQKVMGIGAEAGIADIAFSAASKE